jgi:spore coat polysaccharide biosynthesis predicted glycosyltransferase SpsG
MPASKGGVIFRADGSHTLGMGHVVRSLSLADALRAELDRIGKPLPICFVTKHDPGVEKVLGQSGFNVEYVDGALASFRLIVDEISPRAVVADIDLRGRVPEYLSVIYPRSINVSLHEHNYPILSGDIVVAPTVRPLPMGPGGTLGVTHFIGAEYVLLSPDIPMRRKSLAPLSRDAHTGFISLGGADPNRLTPKMLEAVRACGDKGIEWDVVLGPASGYNADKLAKENPSPFCFHAGSELGHKGFLDLLASSDIVITNGGTTLYESLALGRPTIAIPQNEFEEAVIEQMSAIGACLKAEGDSWLIDSGKRLAIAEKGGSLIDGNGCERVARLITSRFFR